MRASEMQEGKLYQTVGPVGELWPADPEVVLVGESLVQGVTIGDLLKGLEGGQQPAWDTLPVSGLRVVKRAI